MRTFNESITLLAICDRIVEVALENIKIKESRKEEIKLKLYNEIKTYAKESYKNNILNYAEEITSPEKLFYLKGGKDWGFCKEFLEIEEVKKYKNNFLDIIKENKEIPELNEATKKYTKGNFTSFLKFYMRSVKNRENKICFNIAKKFLMEEYTSIIENIKRENTLIKN